MTYLPTHFRFFHNIKSHDIKRQRCMRGTISIFYIISISIVGKLIQPILRNISLSSSNLLNHFLFPGSFPVIYGAENFSSLRHSFVSEFKLFLPLSRNSFAELAPLALISTHFHTQNNLNTVVLENKTKYDKSIEDGKNNSKVRQCSH